MAISDERDGRQNHDLTLGERGSEATRDLRMICTLAVACSCLPIGLGIGDPKNIVPTRRTGALRWHENR